MSPDPRRSNAGFEFLDKLDKYVKLPDWMKFVMTIGLVFGGGYLFFEIPPLYTAPFLQSLLRWFNMDNWFKQLVLFVIGLIGFLLFWFTFIG